MFEESVLDKEYHELLEGLTYYRSEVNDWSQVENRGDGTWEARWSNLHKFVKKYELSIEVFKEDNPEYFV